MAEDGAARGDDDPRAVTILGYWAYYLVWVVLAYGLRNPLLLVGIVVFLLLRRVLPAPGPLLRALSRMRALREQVEANAANIPARRELAELYLEILRPGRALELLDQARARDPDSAELLYLTGLARHRKGSNEAALEALVAAVEKDPRVRFGEPYRVAGRALMALKRYPEAEDAFERYVEANTSAIDGPLQLAIVRAAQGRRDDARASLDEARSTWRQIPRSLRRRQRGAWLRAQWARVWLAREPGALVFVVVFVGLLGVGAALAAPRVAHVLAGGPAAGRFQRLPADAARHAKLAVSKGRWELGSSGEIDDKTMSVGDFVCRLWTAFGPPDRTAGGFSYAFLDHATGAVVTASGAPPMFGATGGADKGLAAIRALDAIVERTKPRDCRIQYSDNGDVITSGVKGGLAFDTSPDGDD